MGKTALVIRQMLNISKKNIPVLLFSYEMSKRQLSQRMVAMESRVWLEKIKTGNISEQDLQLIKDVYLDIGNYPIYVDSNMSAALGYVLSTIRRYVRTNGVKVVFLDYLGLMVHDASNETIELGRISRALKMLAMELDITIIAVSQLSRAVESRDNKRPVLADLRQSGRLEEDADIVLMLYRPQYYSPQTGDKEYEVELLLRKNRNGPIGIPKAYFDPKTVNIVNSLAEVAV
jgi:replicative DNA helicase